MRSRDVSPQVWTLINMRVLDTAGIKVFVLDEADEMLMLGGLGDTTKRIRQRLPKTVQTLKMSTNWKERQAALAAVTAALREHPRLSPGVGLLLEALKPSLRANQVALVLAALSALGSSGELLPTDADLAASAANDDDDALDAAVLAEIENVPEGDDDLGGDDDLERQIAAELDGL